MSPEAYELLIEDLEAERNQLHARCARAEALNARHAAQREKAIARFGLLPGEHWTARFLQRFGLMRIRDAL